ncbi:MAG: cytidylate kinase family protein [Candidatus Woesearchaeota archaeon]|nr:cytidylate kinase family protein [Candidatus Woesearchaeota archaeon]
MRITLSGTAGSGKSTVAKMLAKKLGYKHYSMGDIQREIAKEKGITIVELGELEKKDKSIDLMIDERQREIGRQDDIIVDSWLAALFIPDSFKIFLDADIEVRAKRITKEREAESYTSIEDAKKAILKREKTNISRFKKFYKYDFMDKRNYDLVIDTSYSDVDTIIKKIIEAIKS